MLSRRHFAASMAAVPFMAIAQDWPHQPVRWVLSQPPGSGPDNVARLIADKLTGMWGQAVVIDNKPGGQNVIGAQNAARAAPNGYTFYFATTAALVTNTVLFKKLPYDPVKDFAPVAFVARSPFAVLVKADSPIASLEDLITRIAAGTVSIGNEGPRTFGGIVAQLLNARAGGKANLISYASVGTCVQDTLGGHVDALVADIPSTASLIKEGSLRVLSVSSPTRQESMPAVPALTERYPGLELTGWFALVAPTGTPVDVIARVNSDVYTVLNDADIRKKIAAIGPVVETGRLPSALAGFLDEERVRWNAIAATLQLSQD